MVMCVNCRYYVFGWWYKMAAAAAMLWYMSRDVFWVTMKHLETHI